VFLSFNHVKKIICKIFLICLFFAFRVIKKVFWDLK